MKKLLYLSVLAFCSIAFMGCPYSAEIPLDDATVKIMPELLGKWESKSSTDYTYTVTKADDYKYSIEKKSASSGDITSYKGYLSDVDGQKYMNIYEESESTVTYYFYKVEVSTSGARCTLSPVTENIDEKFTASGEMKAFFKKHQGTSFFFDKDDDVYLKM